LVVGLPVLLGGLTVSDTHTQQETAGVFGLDPVVGTGERLRVGLPHVDDARGHGDALGRVEQGLDDPQILRRGATDPDGAVAESLHFVREVGVELERRTPDTDRAEVYCHDRSNTVTWSEHSQLHPTAE